MRRCLMFGLLLAVVPGCFGSFRLTNTVYEFNRDLSDSIVVQEVVFLLFIIVPVYEISTFVDAVVLNTIEALTGDNPIGLAPGEPGESRVAVLEDGTEVTVIPEVDRILVSVRSPDGEEVVRDLRMSGRDVTVLDGSGTLLAEARRGVGGRLVVDEGGQLTEVEQELIEHTARQWRKATKR